MELEEFRSVLDRRAAANHNGSIQDARIYLVTCNEEGPPKLRELLDPWMISEAQAYAAEGWRHTIFAVSRSKYGSPDYEWTNIRPEKVENCTNADDAGGLCDEILEKLSEQFSLRYR